MISSLEETKKHFDYVAALGYVIAVSLLFMSFLDSNATRRLFPGVLLVLAVLSFVKSKINLQLMRSPAVLSGLVLIAYCLLSLTWGENSHWTSYIGRSIDVGIFWVAVVIACQTGDRQLVNWSNSFLLCASIVCVYMIANYIFVDNWQGRDPGPGILWSPITGPSIILIYGTIAICLQRLVNKLNIWGVAIFMGLCLVYIFMTKSRGPMVGVMTWLGLLVLLDRRNLSINLKTVCWIVLAAVIFFAFFPEYWTHLLVRGTAGRGFIWKEVISILPEHLWFGRGISTDFHSLAIQGSLVAHFGHLKDHPHNLELAIILYLGLIGLLIALFCTFIGLAQLIFKRNPAVFCAAPVIFVALILTLTDTDQLIDHASRMWYLFWLPVAFVAGITFRELSKVKS